MKQRFSALTFDYPPAELETRIVATETGTTPDVAGSVVRIAAAARNLKGHGLDEGISTHLLVYAANLMAVQGIPPREASRMALVDPTTHYEDIRSTLHHAIDAVFA